MALAKTDDTEAVKEYIAFIKTLYESRKTLTAGIIGHAICLGAVYWSTADTVYLWGVMALVAIWALRSEDMKKFDLVDIDGMTRAEASRWERRYIVGSTSAGLTLGLSGAYSLFMHQNPAAMVVAVGLSMTTLVAVVGRNFGSKANIDIITAAACVPLAAGMMLSGNVYLSVIGLSFIPMFFSTREMAETVRSMLREAYRSRNTSRDLAEEFDAALNNMPHGLLMLDSGSRVRVANSNAARLLGFERKEALTGHTLAAMIRLATSRAMITRRNGSAMEEQFRRLTDGSSSCETIEINGGQFFQVSARSRGEDRGSVLNFEDVTERVLAARKVERLAHYDALSGLPNRAHMKELVAKAVEDMRDGETIAFSVFDIDRFKNINDTMGHSVGDRVIELVGARLNALEDRRAIYSRHGGDEFVLAVPGLRPGEKVEDLLDSLFAQITGNQTINGRKVQINVSGGVIVYGKADFDLDVALTKADAALNKSKNSENTTWTLFDREMDAEFRETQKIKAALKQAIEDGSLSVVYQPMLSVDGLSIACCETLARWTHPEFGPIGPARFIPLAESMGLIGDVTKLVLSKACRDCMTWPDLMTVSVNLSAIDIANPEIVSVIRAALDGSGLPPHRLQVEITETVLVGDKDKAASILGALRQMGVKTALDDFGTGYSSLGYMHSLPLDKIKVDRTFVERIDVDDDERRLLRAMTRLIKDLGFEIVVEGIETEAQLEALREIGGVDLVQGYVFGMPMECERIPGFMANMTVRNLHSATIHHIGHGRRERSAAS